MAANYCKYIKICPIYQGKEETNVASLSIYKNVFCIRGMRGWKNCEQFLKYEKQEKTT